MPLWRNTEECVIICKVLAANMKVLKYASLCYYRKKACWNKVSMGFLNILLDYNTISTNVCICL